MREFKKFSAFTLVELVVVVAILAILGTIGFVSYSSYISGVRDTNRISQITTMYDGIELYKIKNNLFLPNDEVEVKVNGENIAYQGYIGKANLLSLEYSNGGVDPKDKTYFSYYLTDDRKYFQLLAFLENNQMDLSSSCFTGDIPQNNTGRYQFVRGSKLGILTDEDNIPIQEISDIKGNGYIDVGTTNNIYVSNLNNGEYVIGSGSKLNKLKDIAKVGGKFCGCSNEIISCSSLIPSGITSLPSSGNLIGYWDFEGDYSDKSIILNNGLPRNGAFIDNSDGDASRGNYVNLYGTEDYVEIPHNSNYVLNNGSISLWVKGDDSFGIFSKDSSGFDTGGHFTIRIHSSGEVEVRLQSVTNHYFVNSSSFLTKSQWNHIVITFGSTGLKMYINGILNSTNPYNGGLVLNEEPIALGCVTVYSGDNIVTPVTDCGDSLIDDVAIYNSILDSNEVLEIYNIQK